MINKFQLLPLSTHIKLLCMLWIWFPVSRISVSLPGKKFGRNKFISWLYFLFFEIICNEPTNSIMTLKLHLNVLRGTIVFFFVQQLQFEAGIVLPQVLRGKIEVLVAQSNLTLCDPMDHSLPGSSVHGSLQARILEWVAISFSRGSSWPRDWIQVSSIAGRLFTN